MNKFLLLLLLFLINGASSDAQEMTVKSFKKLDNDLTAKRQGTSRIDGNGKTAALIRVIAPDKGYSFDGGSLGLVGDADYHGGEIWVYVPGRAQKISISHPKFGVLRDYYYEVPVTSGSTYELVLDPGVGAFYNISTSISRAALFIDGDSVGVSPLANHYIIYGKHHIEARVGRMFGEIDFVAEKDNNNSDIRIEMQDVSHNYVPVTFTVADNAEIWFDDVKKGVGTWKAELYKGEYVIQTRKANCESRLTTIKVTPGVKETVVLEPPVPYKGYLRVKAYPLDAVITSGKRTLVNDTQTQLNAGNVALTLSRKGYYSQTKEYNILRNELTTDTVRLSRISYVKSRQIYFGCGFTYNYLSGFSAILGGTLKNIDLQLSYTFGIKSSDDMSWYENNEYHSTVNYKQNVIGVHAGYQMQALKQCAITPYLGYSLLSLSATQVKGTDKIGDSSKCSCLSLGAKVVFLPFENLGVFVSPEYLLPLKKDKTFEVISDVLDMTSGGFSASAGLIVKF